MACKHPPDHIVIKYDCDGLPDPLELSWRECLDCGAWLPLGPASDTPDEVRIEIRAASMLACHEANARCCCFNPNKFLAPIGLELEARDLARCIVEHKDSDR